MRTALLVATLLLSAAWAGAQDVPSYQRSTEQDQDLGGLANNFRDLADRGKDNVGGSQVPGNRCFGTDAWCYNDQQNRVDIGPNGICFTSNGSCMTSGATSSSFTYLTQGATNAGNTLGICVTGSTVTLTCQAGTVEVVYSGTIRASDINSLAVGFLVDGAFVSPYNAARGVIRTYDSSGNGTNGSFTFPDISVSAGSHKFCLTLRATGADGTQSVGWTGAGIEGLSRFGVRQIQ